MISIDSALKAKLNNYNLVKGSLTQMQRRKLCVHLNLINIYLTNPIVATCPHGRSPMLYRKTTSFKTRNTWRPYW